MSNDSKRKPWLHQIIIWTSVIAVLLCLVAFVLPYALKRYVEEHSVEWIDRKITIDNLVLNPFTFRYAVNGVICTEPNKEDVFVSWRSISLRADLWSAFQNDDWLFDQVRIKDPYFSIAQQGDRFNFTDLIELGENNDPSDTSTTLFSMRDVRIEGGRIDYTSDILRAPLQIETLEALCTEISSGKTHMEFDLGFNVGGGGRLDGGFMIDTEDNSYGIDAQLKQFNITELKPYLNEFFACDRFDGSMDLELHLLNDFDDTTSLVMSAAMDLSDINLTDPNGDQLITWKSANGRLDTLVAADQLLEMNEVNIDGAAMHFILLNDESDNWTRLMTMDSTVVDGETVATVHASESNVFLMLASYIGSLAEQVITNKYSAEKLSITNASVHFEDHTPAQPFRYDIAELNVSTQRVTNDQNTSTIVGSATLQQTGKLEAQLVFDPNNIKNVDVDLTLDRLALDQLDAYSRWYAAHPLEDGLFDLTSRTSIKDGKLRSENGIRIDRLKVGKKIKEHEPDAVILPLRLASGLLKDVNGVVELDVPVAGDLKDPTFKPWPIVWKIFKDLIVKAASAPGKLLARSMQGTDPEDLERVRFAYLQRRVDDPQRKTLGQLAKAIKSNAELTVELISTTDKKAEAQEVSVFLAKRSYLFPEKDLLEASDSLKVDELSTTDSLFLAFVKGRTPDLNGRSTYERCVSITGAEVCNTVVEELETSRQASVLGVLQKEGIAKERIIFRAGTSEELAGHRGVPGYRFIYDVGDTFLGQEGSTN